MFLLNRRSYFFPLNADDVSALITYQNGKRQRRETGYGNSFLSQSGRFLIVDGAITSIEITDSRGRARRVTL